MPPRDAERTPLELDLVARCVRRDAAAWQELIANYGSLILHATRTTLSRVLKNVDSNQVEEASQSVWASLCDDDCRRLRSFAGQSALSTWLTVISTRRALDFIRTEMRKGGLRHVHLETEENDLIGDLQGPEAPPSPSSGEEREMVYEALDRLEPQDRLILKMYYLDGETYRTIARLLRLAPNTISSYLFRAREKLKTLLAQKKS